MQAIIEGNLYEIEPAVKVILDRVMTENAELKRENKRLEEAYQKATGVIATDGLPTAVDLYKLKKKCADSRCCECEYGKRGSDGVYDCAFVGLPLDWNFGGADNETD